MKRRRAVRRKRRVGRRRRGGAAVSRARAPTGLVDRAKAFLRRHKLVSRGLSALHTAVGSRPYAPVLSGLSQLADSHGYGRRRRRVRRRTVGRPRKTRRRRGAGFFSSIGDAFKRVGRFALDKLRKPSGILGALSMIPTPLSGALKVAGTAAGIAGHGRRRRRRGVRRRRRVVRRRRGRGASMASMTSPLAVM